MPRLSGFPEFLPHQHALELQIIDAIRRAAALYGFMPVETRAVEPVSLLIDKGETDKEIYAVSRLQSDLSGEPRDAKLGLHFDLTVPLARYVVDNQASLHFPFKRYQIQKSWRGERPQEGRYREFTQADIDVIARGKLPLSIDSEIVECVIQIWRDLPLPPVDLKVNNRKILDGFLKGAGIDNVEAAIRVIDKIGKIGREETLKMLVEVARCDIATADLCLRLASIETSDNSFVERVRDLGVNDPELDQGLRELSEVLDPIITSPQHSQSVHAFMGIARGFNYYTGTVFEGYLTARDPRGQVLASIGSVVGGGRYDDLARDGKHRFPGVGASIGITRILVPLFARDAIQVPSRLSAPQVLVTVRDESERARSNEVARVLRRRRISCEVYHESPRFGVQIDYAARRGIRFVWFVGASSEQDEVKDLDRGIQVNASAASFHPNGPE